MTRAELDFKRSCQLALDAGVVPTPGHFGVRSLDGRRCRWREEVLVQNGYAKHPLTGRWTPRAHLMSRTQVSRAYARGDGRLLRQSAWWRPAEGRSLRLEEMEDRHRRNLMSFLLEKAGWVWLEDSVDFIDGDRLAGPSCPAEEWIRASPLFRRLAELSP